jgi:hypothetical protein
MTNRNNFTLVAIIALTTLAAACGSLSAKQSVAPQLEEARALNTELRGEWTATQEMLNGTLAAVEEFPKMGIDPSMVDVDLLKKALTECFEAPLASAEESAKSGDVATGEDAAAMAEDTGAAMATKCEGESMSALNDMSGKASPEVGTFIQSKVGAISMIKVNLKEKLPAKATEIGQKYAAAKLKVEELRLTADGLKTAADANSLMNDKEKAAFATEYEALQAELAGLDELLGSMESEALGLPDRLRTTQETFVTGLANFGQ